MKVISYGFLRTVLSQSFYYWLGDNKLRSNFRISFHTLKKTKRNMVDKYNGLGFQTDTIEKTRVLERV